MTLHPQKPLREAPGRYRIRWSKKTTCQRSSRTIEDMKFDSFLFFELAWNLFRGVRDSDRNDVGIPKSLRHSSWIRSSGLPVIKAFGNSQSTSYKGYHRKPVKVVFTCLEFNGDDGRLFPLGGFIALCFLRPQESVERVNVTLFSGFTNAQC